MLFRSTPKKFDFQIGARFIGERQDNDFVFGVNRNTSYATAYLSASWRATPHVAPFLRIGNLNNERYQEALGYASLARMTFGGVKLSW